MVIMSKNAAEYGIQDVAYEPPADYDSLELQTPTHISLIAAALDMSIGELKELNPALIKSVAPGGYALHVPKGSLPQLEAALRVIPADRRDSWRVHRVEAGDTFAAVAKRYGTTPELLASANHDQLPEAGTFAAVPVSYPGDRPAATKTATKKTSSRTSGAKTAAARTTGKKAAAARTTRKPAAKPAASATGKTVRTSGKRAAGA